MNTANINSVIGEIDKYDYIRNIIVNCIILLSIRNRLQYYTCVDVNIIEIIFSSSLYLPQLIKIFLLSIGLRQSIINLLRLKI
jgi:hypothetical protein